MYVCMYVCMYVYIYIYYIIYIYIYQTKVYDTYNTSRWGLQATNKHHRLGSHIVGHHFPCILHLKYQVSERTMSFGSFEIWAQKNNDPANPDAPLLVKMVEPELQ